MKKPPLGVTPQYILNENRIKELQNAIVRYFKADLPIPEYWLKEYNERICKKDKLHKEWLDGICKK